MYECRICHNPEVVFDDCWMVARDGVHCLCIRCAHTRIGDQREVPAALRRALERITEGI